jgi:hypothetical protein
MCCFMLKTDGRIYEGYVFTYFLDVCLQTKYFHNRLPTILTSVMAPENKKIHRQSRRSNVIE